MINLGNFFFRYRNGLFPLAFVLLLIPSPNAFPEWWIAALFGFGLVILGQIIRGATVGLVYIVRGGRNGRVYADDLVTEGLFSHCRNPLYVGNFLGILGALVASNSVVAIAAGGAFFVIAYLSITLAEEAFLLKKFGENYLGYCAKTPRFSFRMTGLESTLRASRFNWPRLVVKEYGTIFVSLAGVPLILLFKRHYGSDLPWGDGWDLGLMIGVSILAISYCLARWLKKSGRITE